MLIQSVPTKIPTKFREKKIDSMSLHAVRSRALGAGRLSCSIELQTELDRYQWRKYSEVGRGTSRDRVPWRGVTRGGTPRSPA